MHSPLDNIAGSEFPRRILVVPVLENREENDLRSKPSLLQLPGDFEAAYSRHSNVHNNNVRLESRHGDSRLLRITHSGYDPARTLQNFAGASRTAGQSSAKTAATLPAEFSIDKI
jgi:hypothetical protein